MGASRMRHSRYDIKRNLPATSASLRSNHKET